MLSPILKGLEFSKLATIDEKLISMDGIQFKEIFGMHTLSLISFAIAEAAANIFELDLFLYLSQQFNEGITPNKFKLPSLFHSLIRGGIYYGCNSNIKEIFLTVNRKKPLENQIQILTEINSKLATSMPLKTGAMLKDLGTEGGFILNLTTEEIFLILEEIVKSAGFKSGEDIFYSLDVSAECFFNHQEGKYEIEKGNFLRPDELFNFYTNLLGKFPAIISIEDPFSVSDIENWIKITSSLSHKIQIIGASIYQTNPNLIKKGIEQKWSTGLLLQINQIGTISAAFEVSKMILNSKQTVLISNEINEPRNTSIVDFAIGIGAQQIKFGKLTGVDKNPKYIRLFQIYKILKDKEILDEE